MGSPVKMRSFLVPSLGGTGGHCCNASQLLHKVLQGGHTSADAAIPVDKALLVSRFSVCFLLLPAALK